MNLEALVSSGNSPELAEAMLGTLAKERVRDADIPDGGYQIRGSAVVVFGSAREAKRLNLPDPDAYHIGEGEEITVYNNRTGNHNVEVHGFAQGVSVVVGQYRYRTFTFVGGIWTND